MSNVRRLGKTSDRRSYGPTELRCGASVTVALQRYEDAELLGFRVAIGLEFPLALRTSERHESESACLQCFRL